MKPNAEVPVHTVYYKFSLSGALIVLLDPQSGCTGEGSAVVLCNTDLGGSAGEQAALVGNVGALLILCSGICCTRGGFINWNVVRNLITLELKMLSSSTNITMVSPKCSTFLSGYQVWTWGISHVFDNAWHSGTTSWIEDSNVILWDQRKTWLLGCFIILRLLHVLSKLQLNIDVSICREQGLWHSWQIGLINSDI